MKTLSIRQPWAWCIVNGYKSLENRSYETKIRGSILIHASKKFDVAGYAWIKEKFPLLPLPEIGRFDMGGIVGMTEIIATREANDKDFTMKLVPRYSDWRMPAEPGKKRIFWLFGSAEELPFLPCKGKLKFFDAEHPSVNGYFA